MTIFIFFNFFNNITNGLNNINLFLSDGGGVMLKGFSSNVIKPHIALWIFITNFDKICKLLLFIIIIFHTPISASLSYKKHIFCVLCIYILYIKKILWLFIVFLFILEQDSKYCIFNDILLFVAFLFYFILYIFSLSLFLFHFFLFVSKIIFVFLTLANAIHS